MTKIRIPRVRKCPCGSGKMYKRCCGKIDESNVELILREPPLSIYVESTGSEKSSIIVSDASMSVGDVTRTMLDEELVVSTNKTKGDKLDKSRASVVIPFEEELNGFINLEGNASVTNESEKHTLKIRDNRKKIKIKNEDGLYCIVRIVKQRDEDLFFFDIIFGIQGEKETVDSSGQKNRPHIAFYPDGNGKFIRLSEYDCELKSSMSYMRKSKSIYPEQVAVTANKYNTSILLKFTFDEHARQVVLESVEFMT